LYAPHRVALYSIAILVVGGNGEAVPMFAKVGKLMSTHFEFSLVQGCIAMRRSLDQAKLGAVRRAGGMDVHGQSH
jgi:hypothetical protein